MGYYFKLSDIDSPVIMQTGRAADYPGGFEEFRKAVLEKARLAVDGNAVAYTSWQETPSDSGPASRRLPNSTEKRST